MKKILLIIFPLSLFALSPFETPKDVQMNVSVFNTKRTIDNKKAMKNEKIQCRYICDKKLYKEQKIADALLFYKKRIK